MKHEMRACRFYTNSLMSEEENHEGWNILRNETELKLWYNIQACNIQNGYHGIRYIVCIIKAIYDTLINTVFLCTWMKFEKQNGRVITGTVCFIT